VWTQLNGSQIRQGRNKVPVAAVNALGIEPLKIEERVGAKERRPVDHLIERLLILLTRASIAPAKNKVLIDWDTNNGAMPLLNDELNLRARDGCSGKEPLLIWTTILET